MRTVSRLTPPILLPPEEAVRIRQTTTAYVEVARALDAPAVTALLADDVVYESQWVLEPIVGRKAVGDYIAGKYLAICRPDAAKLEICLGTIDLPQGLDYPVALVTQFGKRVCFVALTVDDSANSCATTCWG